MTDEYKKDYSRMPEYRLICPKFWYDSRGLLDRDGKLVAVHAFTARHTNRIGVFSFSTAGAADDLEMQKSQYEKSFADVCAKFKWPYDPDARVLALRTWFKYNIVNSRDTLKGYLRELSSVSNSPVLLDWRKHALLYLPEKVHEIFHERTKERLAGLSETQLEIPIPKAKPEKKKVEFSETIHRIYDFGQPIFTQLGHKEPKNEKEKTAQKKAIHDLINIDSETETSICRAVTFLLSDVFPGKKWQGWGKVCGNFISLRRQWEKIKPLSSSTEGQPGESLSVGKGGWYEK